MRWTSAGCEFSRVPETATVGGVTMPVTPPDLDAAMARIDEAGRASFPESYAGLEVDQGQVRAIVYRVPSDAFDDVVRAAAGSVCIEVRDAAHSLRELLGWRDRVVGDLNGWSADGLHIVSVGPRHDGTGVEVGVADVERDRERLLSRYGPEAPLVIVGQDPVTPLSGG